MEVVVREARSNEIGRLEDVERDGDRRYRGYDGVPLGFDDTVAPAVLAEAATERRLWVAGPDDDDEILGFALAEVLDGQAHLAQLSVRLAFQGRGLGGRLVGAVRHWARARSLGGVTLCTFSDVSWNRPLYEHWGFVVVVGERVTPGLRAVFEADGDLGLDLGRRVVMRLSLSDD